MSPRLISCLLYTSLKLDLPNYAPEECPICKEGKLPLVHLGSRKYLEKQDFILTKQKEQLAAQQSKRCV